jgi:hypothetical protein
MTDYFRRHLGAKLLLSYLVIILVGGHIGLPASLFCQPPSTGT